MLCVNWDYRGGEFHTNSLIIAQVTNCCAKYVHLSVSVSQLLSEATLQRELLSKLLCEDINLYSCTHGRWDVCSVPKLSGPPHHEVGEYSNPQDTANEDIWKETFPTLQIDDNSKSDIME